MGLEHSFKEPKSMRCPLCNRWSKGVTYEQGVAVFYCSNERCIVERVYCNDIVEVVGDYGAERDGGDTEAR